MLDRSYINRIFHKPKETHTFLAKLSLDYTLLMAMQILTGVSVLLKCPAVIAVFASTMLTAIPT
ncbi:hypothetical protein NQ317_001416 [Molorchus minor]|uniref:Uncharacterized protein n=1 Tax=Molorchus minor TaxID=1323400 RepID=A0ABQ9JYM8_9CUCU|nr:hypothetical protein NQ317_001416 [Molorchus minor]